MNNLKTKKEVGFRETGELLKGMQQHLIDIDAKLDHLIKEKWSQHRHPSIIQRTLDYAGFEKSGGEDE